MSLYEIEVALFDDYIVSYVDLNDYTQCYLEYCGADTVLLTKETEFGEMSEFHNMSSLLFDIENEKSADNFKLIEKL